MRDRQAVLAFSLHTLFAFLHHLLHLIFFETVVSMEQQAQNSLHDGNMLNAAATKCEESQVWL